MHRSIPFAIGALFLIFIGCGIYRKAQMAVAPPIYDPISYYIKAKVVWDALSKGRFCWNAQRSVREQTAWIRAIALSTWVQIFYTGLPLSLRVCPDCHMDVGVSNYRCCICASVSQMPSLVVV